jgi:putative RNA 2'-phosphotransferase
MKQDVRKISKFLSYILRHRPDEIGLNLDAEGWADISELLEKSQRKIFLTRSLLDIVVEDNDKKRFRISDDGLKIRASQGHSLNVNLNLQPQIPPDILFHGTATRFLSSILKDGLKSGSRQFVHLSNDRDTAHTVGSRHGSAVILTVAAGEMVKGGHKFYLSDNGVWLTDAVAPRYLSQ